MTDGPWQWIRPRGRLRYEYNATLTFLRGVDEARIVAEFDADPTTRRLLTSADAEQENFGHRDWLRVADLGDWVVVEEPNSIRATIGAHGRSTGAALRLARSATEAVALSFVVQDGITSFDYWRGGTWLTSSEIGRFGVTGEDPTRFDAAFAAAGMTSEFAALDDRVVQVLTALGREVGISLPSGVLDGPLPTYTFLRPLQF